MHITDVTAVNGVVIGRRQLTRNLPDLRSWAYVAGHRPGTIGTHAGCLQSHMEAWSWVSALSAMDSDPEVPSLVVEDDAVFRDPCECPYRANNSHTSQCKQMLIWTDMALPHVRQTYSYCDFLYLGGQWTDTQGLRRVSPVTRLRSSQVCRSHAYLLTPAAAAFLLDYNWQPDIAWTLQPWVDEMRVGLLYPPMAGQAANQSGITGMIHAERWWE